MSNTYRDCCMSFNGEEHELQCVMTRPGVMKKLYSDAELDSMRRSCCRSHINEYHTPVCTSNEAVLARADSDAAEKKMELVKEYRRLCGDPLDRLKQEVDAGETTVEHETTKAGQFYSFKRAGASRPRQINTPLEDLPPDTRRFLQGAAEERGTSHPAFKHRRKEEFTGGILCDVCQNAKAFWPRERANVLALFWYRYGWRWEGVKALRGPSGDPQRRSDVLQYTQLAVLGRLMVAVEGPYAATAQWKPFYAVSLGRFFRVRPWLCINCRMFKQPDVSQRTQERRTVRGVVGRELQAFGRWLVR